MKAEKRKERLLILSQIDRLEESCDSCEKRKEFHAKKSTVGLSEVCKACPIGQKLLQCGVRLTKTL